MKDILAIVADRCKTKKLDEHQESIIASMVDASADLIVNHFKEIESTRKDNGTNSAQVSIGFTLGYDQGTAKVNTVIAFSKKFRDGREDIVGDPKQMRLLDNDGQPAKPKKGKAK